MECWVVNRKTLNANRRRGSKTPNQALSSVVLTAIRSMRAQGRVHRAVKVGFLAGHALRVLLRVQTDGCNPISVQSVGVAQVPAEIIESALRKATSSPWWNHCQHLDCQRSQSRCNHGLSHFDLIYQAQSRLMAASASCTSSCSLG